MVWLALEIIGTVAFAISGALAGIQKKLDIFGIVMLAIITAVGGGIIRDTLSGNTPPLAFQDQTYVFISIITAIVVFIASSQITRLKTSLLLCDAIGLGAFTATGANLAVQVTDTWFMLTVFGVTTGIGGGILRDVLVQDIPIVFRQEVYAVAALIGATGFYLAHLFFPVHLSMYLCFAITLLIRLVSLHYNINLPSARE